jgi:hypothetical protein
MGIRDRLGHITGHARGDGSGHGSERDQHSQGAEEALETARYKYILRVASPALLEQVHREAFAALPAERVGPLYLKMCHDLPEGQRPKGVAPEELARAAVGAIQSDHGYLLRVLRRPGQGVSEGHEVPGSASRPDVSLYAGSLLGPFAAAAAASAAASEVLGGFEYSLEAAQVDPSVFSRGPNARADGWGQVASGGYDVGGGYAGDGGGGGI